MCAYACMHLRIQLRVPRASSRLRHVPGRNARDCFHVLVSWLHSTFPRLRCEGYKAGRYCEDTRTSTCTHCIMAIPAGLALTVLVLARNSDTCVHLLAWLLAVRTRPVHCLENCGSMHCCGVGTGWHCCGVGTSNLRLRCSKVLMQYSRDAPEHLK